MGPRELEQALRNTRETLLRLRGPHGHWEGELAASALSTAIAVVALETYLRARPACLEDGLRLQLESVGLEIRPTETPACLEDGLRVQLEELCDNGLAWLARTQNSDGGWGDTTLSFSNISTTALCWAAFAGAQERYPEVCRRCAAWLEITAAGLEPNVLAQAIVKRYGKDRTFSVPILTTLALTGRLGPPERAWRLVPQLPFELAACPHQWFSWLRLPVVSYALPALIALGLVRHRHRPTWNPVFRLLRNQLRKRVLRVLHSILPSSGGFLEATPLTSFVVLSLAGAGLADHPVAGAGMRFLARSARTDGSWPIDTNLATWVTTLSVDALAAAQAQSDPLPLEEGQKILAWLLGQQYRVEHPFTHAAPGGWAWTDLPGGVPDGDDTPGALLALQHLGASREALPAVTAGVVWLLDLQNSDGGMPTFCRGWGALPFDRSSADLTAHALRAWSAWQKFIPGPLQNRVGRALDRGVRFLERMQRTDGSWPALWFGNQHAQAEENLTYGTSRVVLALAALNSSEVSGAGAAVAWLLRAQNPDGGWGGMSQTPSTVEETGLALEGLAAAWKSGLGKGRPGADTDDDFRNALLKGFDWLLQKTQGGTCFPPAPIGFYFAKLWYYEKLYPVIFTLAALGRSLGLADRLWKNVPGKALTQ